MPRTLTFQHRKDGGEWQQKTIDFDTSCVEFTDPITGKTTVYISAGAPAFFLEPDMLLRYYEEKELYTELFTFDESVVRFRIPWEKTPRCGPRKDYVGVEYQCISRTITDL